MSSIYSKAHSAGWIDPDGKFIPIEADMIHDDISANFPGVPMDEEFPSGYAVKNLGYLKVSNAFDFLLDGPPRRGDPRVERMAKFTADAVLSYEKRGPPSWLAIPFRSVGTPLEWEVKISQPGLRWETMSVGDFVDRFGSRETSDKLFGHFLDKLHERLLRAMIKRLIRESRRR